MFAAIVRHTVLNLISLLNSRYLDCHEVLLPTLCDIVQIYCYRTVESWFFEPSRETKIRWKNRRVGEIGDRIIVLVRVIRSFDKMRVREIIHSIFSKFCDLKKKKVLFALIIKMWTLFARAFITSTALAEFCVSRERMQSRVQQPYTFIGAKKVFNVIQSFARLPYVLAPEINIIT